MRTEITNNGYMKVLDNGYRVSVIGGKGFYGDGKSSFEIGIWIEEKDVKSTILVVGHQSNEEVEQYIKLLNQLN